MDGMQTKNHSPSSRDLCNHDIGLCWENLNVRYNLYSDKENGDVAEHQSDYTHDKKRILTPEPSCVALENFPLSDILSVGDFLCNTR